MSYKSIGVSKNTTHIYVCINCGTPHKDLETKYEGEGVWVECPNCGKKGEPGKNKTAAIKNWNHDPDRINLINGRPTVTKYIYMKLDSRFDQPIAIAGSVKELSEMTGDKITNIHSALSHARTKGKGKCRYVRMLKEDFENFQK